MGLFSEFGNTTYTFLRLTQGGVKGNTVRSSAEAQGIFKYREGISESSNAENETTNSTLHIKPDEPFVATVNGELTGHGIEINRNGDTLTYRIVGTNEGFDYDTNTLEFYRLTLKREKIAT